MAFTTEPFYFTHHTFLSFRIIARVQKRKQVELTKKNLFIAPKGTTNCINSSIVSFLIPWNSVAVLCKAQVSPTYYIFMKLECEYLNLVTAFYGDAEEQ